MPCISRRWFVLGLVSVAALGGCDIAPKIERDPSFGPARVRLHPTFTQIKDWNGDDKPDGIEVVVELVDEFDEPVRASGKLTFELFQYKRNEPDPAGERLLTPWIGSLLTREDQAQHWSPALRAYTFQLAFPRIGTGQNYMLSVTFQAAATPNSGTTGPTTQSGRLFDRIVLEPLHEKESKHRVRPAVGERIGGSRG